MRKDRILVVEDNDRLRHFVGSALEKAEYRALEADSGKAAHELLCREYLALVLLDLNLGDVNGLEILKAIRRMDAELPVIIVSSLDDPDSKMEGFDCGCDDYITKPFYIEDLLGRAARLIKKSRPRPETAEPSGERLLSGPFELDTGALRATKNGSALGMRRKAFELFGAFLLNPEALLPIDEPRDRRWGRWADMDGESLRVNVDLLRSLVEDEPTGPRYIRSVAGLGFSYSPSGAGNLAR